VLRQERHEFWQGKGAGFISVRFKDNANSHRPNSTPKSSLLRPLNVLRQKVRFHATALPISARYLLHSVHLCQTVFLAIPSLLGNSVVCSKVPAGLSTNMPASSDGPNRANQPACPANQAISRNCLPHHYLRRGLTSWVPSKKPKRLALTAPQPA
jgi:hypothetical protein